VGELDFGPVVEVLGFGPSDESVEGGGVGFLGLFGAAAFVAEGLEEIFYEVFDEERVAEWSSAREGRFRVEKFRISNF
jgi:hypothetical protein